MKKYLHKTKKIHISGAFVMLILATSGLLIFANSQVHIKKPANSLTSVQGLSVSNNVYDINILGISVSKLDSNTFNRTTVKIKLVNKGPELLQVSPGLQMFLESNTGTIYTVTAKYLSSGMTIGGPLGVNESTTLDIDYDIPENETPKTFSYQPDSSKPIAKIGI